MLFRYCGQLVTRPGINLTNPRRKLALYLLAFLQRRTNIKIDEHLPIGLHQHFIAGPNLAVRLSVHSQGAGLDLHADVINRNVNIPRNRFLCAAAIRPNFN